MPRRLILDREQEMILALATILAGLMVEIQIDPATSDRLSGQLTSLRDTLDKSRQSWLDQVYFDGLEQGERNTR